MNFQHLVQSDWNYSLEYISKGSQKFNILIIRVGEKNEKDIIKLFFLSTLCIFIKFIEPYVIAYYHKY